MGDGLIVCLRDESINLERQQGRVDFQSEGQKRKRN